MTLTRISITIPEDLVAAADARAKELDRSRSWLLSDALRRYLAGPTLVREPAVAYRPGLGASRLAQLEADLALTPEERVREAERTLTVDDARGRRPAQDRVLTFDTYEDYLAWDKVDLLRP